MTVKDVDDYVNLCSHIVIMHQPPSATRDGNQINILYYISQPIDITITKNRY